MHELWQIADSAIALIRGARGHLLDGPFDGGDHKAFDAMGNAFSGLHAVCTYTCALREVQTCAQ